MPVERARRQQFHDLFVVMLPEVRTWLRRQGLDQDVDDVAAEVFTVVWRRWSDVPRELGDRRAWVYGVAHNKVRQARAASAKAQDRSALGVFDPTAPGPDPATRVVGDDWVHRALQMLPPSEREAVSLTLLADLSPTQAAHAAGCSVTAMTTRLARARARLERFAASQQYQPEPTGRTR